MEKLKHTKGPFLWGDLLSAWVLTQEKGLHNVLAHHYALDHQLHQVAEYEPTEGDRSLIGAFDELPHSCSDPSCPGDINRRKLEAAEEMAAILKYTHREFDPYHSVFYPNCRVCQILTAWDKAGKGEG